MANLRALSATFILSKNSRVLDANSRLISVNLSSNRLISAKIGQNRPKVDPNSSRRKIDEITAKIDKFISHLRWWERGKAHGKFHFSGDAC